MLGQMRTGVWARFGEFELDSERGLLSVKGYPVKLQLQPLRVLELLVRRAPGVVSREELGDFVWGSGVHVELDANLYYCIRQIRLALRDSASKPMYVETLPKQGYRMVAEVERVAGAAEVAVVLESPEAVIPEPATTGGVGGRGWLGLAAVALGCAVVLAAVGGLWWKYVWGHRQAGAPIRSVAVLPLENLSGDSGEDYFADGMTDELITELASLPNLRVVSRTSAMVEKGSHKTLREIAGELGVDALVEGSVVRSGERVRITVQLIDARDDRHIWAKSFEGQPGDVVAFQDSVAAQIAAQARVALAPRPSEATARAQSIQRRTMPTCAAGTSMPRARSNAVPITFSRRLRQTRHMQRRMPGCPTTWRLKRSSARRRPTGRCRKRWPPLNTPSSSTQRAARPTKPWEALKRSISGTGTQRERDLSRSVALSPSFSVAEMKYGTLLDATGRQAEAVNHLRRAVALDPLSFYMVRRLGATLYLARDYDGALQQLRRAAEMEPGKHDVVDNWMSDVYERKGMHDEAVEHDLAARQALSPQFPVERLRSVYKRQGGPPTGKRGRTHGFPWATTHAPVGIWARATCVWATWIRRLQRSTEWWTTDASTWSCCGQTLRSTRYGAIDGIAICYSG